MSEVAGDEQLRRSAVNGMKPWRWTFLALACLVACGGDQDGTTERADAAATAPDDADVSRDAGAADCSEADAGAPCAADRYCIDGKCRIGVCGDGVVTGAEACDDGNRKAGDGCSAACQREQASCGNGQVDPGEECDDGNLIEQDDCNNRCTMNRCGNGAVDYGEECDDGNQVDADACSNKCLIVSCRNGRLDPGEQCDDGNTVDRDECTNACIQRICGNGKVEAYEDCDDGNRADGDACPSDCIKSTCGNGVLESREICEEPEVTYSSAEHKALWNGCTSCSKRTTTVETDACLKCVKQQCTSYQGLDLVAGCFETPNADNGADPSDPKFIPQCVAAVNCSLKNHCWADPILEGAGCYCGARTIDDCNTQGPATDGTAPCVREWGIEAARSETNADVQARFSDFTYPSGWAYFLLQCIRKGNGSALAADGVTSVGCLDVCAPWAVKLQK